MRLSSPIEDLKPHYTVVVIGSGYGGGIAASRLARAGQQVCVLERGKEFLPGEYPDTELEALPEVQVRLPDQVIGPRTGLYDIRMNDDMSVLVGCGLGGTSLINANVASRPERRVFDDPDLAAGLSRRRRYRPGAVLRSGRRDARLESLSRRYSSPRPRCWRTKNRTPPSTANFIACPSTSPSKMA